MNDAKPRFLKFFITVFGFMGLGLIFGGINELVASFFPQVFPEEIAAALTGAQYEASHSHPVVYFWTRIHNIINIAVGIAQLVGVGLLWRFRASGIAIARASLTYIFITTLVGLGMLFTYVFPALDAAHDLAVPADTLKLSMAVGSIMMTIWSAILLRYFSRVGHAFSS